MRRPILHSLVTTLLCFAASITMAGDKAAVKINAANAGFALIEKSNLTQIKKLSAEDTKSAVNQHGETLLMRAILTERNDIATYLADGRRSNLDQKDKSQNTALMYAISQPNAALVKLLVKAGASLEISIGENAESPLFEAVRLGDRETIALLLKTQPSLLAKADKTGKSALEEAIASAQFKIALSLIDDHKAPLPETTRRQSLLTELRGYPKNASAQELVRRLSN